MMTPDLGDDETKSCYSNIAEVFAILLGGKKNFRLTCELKSPS